MNKPLRVFLLVCAAAAVLALALWGLGDILDEPGLGQTGARLQVARGASEDLPTAGGYARASPDYALSFPEDYGPHPDYQTEWWYYTGNLATAEGRRFGYQLTFFRRALLPPGERIPRESDWGVEQVYLAHFALSDIDARGFHAYEELVRGAAGLAGAVAEPFQVWLYDWTVDETSPGIYRLAVSQDGYALELTLSDLKGPVPQGIDGYSQKGPEPGNASHYFSQTRLVTEGEVVIGGERYPVSGMSWMDHEFSTSALSEGQVGWDWFSLQLDDGSELMVYQIRREDGTVDPFSGGTYIAPDGSTRRLERGDFTIEVRDTWESPHTGAVYPSGWKLNITGLDAELELLPLQPDQELNLSYSYWEGAVSIGGVLRGAAVSGYGYVELTGYAGSFEGEF